MENFRRFQAFLEANGPFDIFIDGANIAHYKQNFVGGTFNYQQIDMCASYLQQEGYKVLIVLHEHHFDQPTTDLPEVLAAFSCFDFLALAGAEARVQGGEGEQRRLVLDVRRAVFAKRRDGEEKKANRRVDSVERQDARSFLPD